MMKLKVLMLTLLCAAIAWFGCQNLDVMNQNVPDQNRSVGTAEDLESLVAGTFQAWMEATHWYTPDALAVAADALTCSWGNFAMREISNEPRNPYDNTTSANYAYVSEDPWYGLYATISSCNDALRALKSGELEFGTNGEDTNRGIAFAKFVQGIAHGYVALFYDQGYIFDESVDLATTVLELQPYDDVMAAALTQIEEAISVAGGGFANNIPSSWINGLELTSDDLVKLANSYAARLRASVGRTPTERAAVDWNKVLSYTNNAIAEDFAPEGDGAVNWWHSLQWYHHDGLAIVEGGASRTTWARVDYRQIGGSDKSSGYADWLATPSALKNQFEMDTDDKRIWSGNRLTDVKFDGWQEKGKYIAYAGNSPWPATRGTYHYTHYALHRYADYRDTGGDGPMYILLSEEIDFLRAEALLRTGGDVGEVVDIINSTRVANGEYPALDVSTPEGAPTDAASPLPGTSLWANLKYEKGIECLATGPGVEFFDKRGWGDLQSGTITQFPVPGKELQILTKDMYTYGGKPGEVGSAPKRFNRFGWKRANRNRPQ